ncbi:MULTISPECIES: hypothetical protein [unclassified Moorena]|nr:MULTISPECIES: hypothetical protein [unclassified Moorena]
MADLLLKALAVGHAWPFATLLEVRMATLRERKKSSIPLPLSPSF